MLSSLQSNGGSRATPPSESEERPAALTSANVTSITGSTLSLPLALPAVLRQPPEIMDAVFEHLANDRRSLAFAARTCRAWFASAARVLWRAPLAPALRCVSGAERRQMYGRAMRKLAIHEGTEALGLADWHFPAVHSLQHGYEVSPQRPHVLAMLLERCDPQKLTRVDVGWNAACKVFFWNLAFKSNRCNTCRGSTGRIAGKMLLCLARRAGLLELSSLTHVSRSAVEYCLRFVAADANPPFSQLERLYASVSSDAIPAVVTLVKR